MRLATIMMALSLAFVSEAAPLKKIAKETGIELTLLKNAFKAGVDLNYDDLKERLEASASDIDIMFSAVSESESRTLQVSWTQGVEGIEATAIYTHLYGDPSIFAEAEVYLGRELLFTLNSKASNRLGEWNQVAREHEKIARVSGPVKLSELRELSETDPSEITIRFYSPDGYEDAKPKKRLQKRLVALIALIESQEG